MICGDDVSAVVVDVGTCTTKAGYAGEDAPRCVVPSPIGVVYHKVNDSVVGGGQKEIGDAANTTDGAGASTSTASRLTHKDKIYYVEPRYREHLEIKYPVQEGLITDWDAVEKIWWHVFFERMKINPKEHPILLAEASFNTEPNREKAAELAFEKFETEAFFISKNAVLAAFASGRANALVFESGGGVTLATPVHEGYVLNKAMIKSTFAGEELTQLMYQSLTSRGTVIRPHYMLDKKVTGDKVSSVTVKDLPNVDKSYHEYEVMNYVRDVKETMLRVSEKKVNPEIFANMLDEQVSLPDGSTAKIGPERLKLPESLFYPELIESMVTDKTVPRIGYQNMINNSIQNCDSDLRRELVRSVVVSGGNTLIKGFPDRLTNELSEVLPQQLKKEIKIIAPSVPAERKFSVFIGGSILGSLGTFHQMWVSKSEYEEHGKGIVERKCP